MPDHSVPPGASPATPHHRRERRLPDLASTPRTNRGPFARQWGGAPVRATRLGTMARGGGAGRAAPAYKKAKGQNKRLQSLCKHVDKDTGEEKLVSKPTPYTMSGLAYALGVDRQTLLNYSKKADFFGTIKKAKTRIEQSVEERLLGSTGVVAGQIFALKQNFGWDALTNEDDKKEAHITVQILQGYGIKPGEVVIDAEEVKHLKGIASGKEIIDL